MTDYVALTTSFDPRGGGFRQPQVHLYANYIQVLQRVGLTAILVTPAHDRDRIRALIDAAAGLVLSGGEDIEPWRYGEKPIMELDDINPVRDQMEWEALEAALDRGVPVLGICRGMQVLNAYLGGTLYQDLPTQYADTVGHYQDAPWGQHHHEARSAEGSRLHHILAPCEPLRINSFHHQAVKELAPPLECTVQAEDGLIEGVESTEHEWVVGIQWHPERHEAEVAGDDPNIRVMEAFADQVRSWARQRESVAP